MRLRFSPALLAFALLGPASPLLAGGNRILPYVGTLESFDPAERLLAFRGPDGKSRSVKLTETASILGEKSKDPTPEELARMKGQTLGLLLTTPKDASHLFLTRVDAKEARGWLREVVTEDQTIRFELLDGDMVLHKPAVNMGAAAAEGETPGPAGWEWFGKHIGAPLRIKTISVMGRPFLWSVEPWKPGPDEKPTSQRAR